MRIIVVGAGAIGSLVGGKLARANEVTLVARPEHAAAINARGLVIEGLEPETVFIEATTDIERIEPDTLILVTTKVPATREALAPLTPLVRADTTIVSLQNGLGSEAVVAQALAGRGVVLRGITQAGAIFVRPGVVRYMVAAETVIASHVRSERICDLFNAAALPCRVAEEMAAEVWQKLIFNCVVNPITAILGSEVGAIANPDLDRLKQHVIDECVRVAAAEGVRFELDFLARINELYGNSRNVVSMLQDLRRGRPTEIDYLNSAVAALGAKHGLACPVNAGLAAVIKGMEAPSAHCSQRKCSSRSWLSRDLASSLRAPPANASFS